MKNAFKQPGFLAKMLSLAAIIAGTSCFHNSALADSSSDINDLVELIKTSKTKVVQSNKCERSRLGYYQFPTEDKNGDILVVCANNIDMKDPSALWEVLAHESAHIMQACNGGLLWKDDYHPRLLRNLKEQAPHYAETLGTYRGGDKMMELEAFDIELKTSGEVKDLFTKFCLSGNQPSPAPSKPSSEGDIAVGIAGGREAYVALLEWAADNLSKAELKNLADILESNDYRSIQAALSVLSARQSQAMQYAEYRLF